MCYPTNYDKPLTLIMNEKPICLRRAEILITGNEIKVHGAIPWIHQNILQISPATKPKLVHHALNSQVVVAYSPKEQGCVVEFEVEKFEFHCLFQVM